MKRIVVLLFTVASLALASSAVFSHAARPSCQFQYLLGTGFLCSLPNTPNPCPDIAKAADGDRIELAGQGTFDVNARSVTGGGDFTHRNAGGTVLASGTWSAKQFITFQDYGNGTPQGLPENTEGGRFVLRVHVSPAGGGSGHDAILQVNCQLGTPPAGTEEGFTLAIQDAINFNKKVSGVTVFVRQ